MSRPRIHSGALIDPAAELDSSVEVGAFAVIGANVRIGAGSRVGPHAVIEGDTTIGRNNRIFQFASIGAAPQDKKYGNEPTSLRIGDGNTIREFVTINRGTVQDRGVTTIGHDNWIMAYVHIAHDCVIGDHTIFANTTNLGGHVQIADWVILGGCTQVHQHCKIGAHAMTAVSSVVLHDVPPFVMVSGGGGQARGINSEGLRRRGFSAARINAIRRAYRTLYKSGLTLDEAISTLGETGAQAEAAREEGIDADLAGLIAFLKGVSRGIVR
jgi:UDP-N-acetylglucosamine acyltransferase